MRTCRFGGQFLIADLSAQLCHCTWRDQAVRDGDLRLV